MSLSLPIFRKQFQLYRFGDIACVAGRVCRSESDKLLVIGKTADKLYTRLYGRLKVGMSIEDAFDIWSAIVEHDASYQRWDKYRNWSPKPHEYWVGKDGNRYHVSAGMVHKAHGNYKGQLVKVTADVYELLRHVSAGTPIAQLRTYLATNMRGAGRWQSIYDFKPKVTIKCDKDRREPKKEKPPITKTSGYDRTKCPPLCSMDDAKVRIMYPDNKPYLKPDLFQVRLFCLTRVWANEQRTIPNPELKENLREYVRYAYHKLGKDPYMKEHPEVYRNLKSGKIHITYDCCLEIDFVEKGDKK